MLSFLLLSDKILNSNPPGLAQQDSVPTKCLRINSLEVLWQVCFLPTNFDTKIAIKNAGASWMC